MALPPAPSRLRPTPPSPARPTGRCVGEISFAIWGATVAGGGWTTAEGGWPPDVPGDIGTSVLMHATFGARSCSQRRTALFVRIPELKDLCFGGRKDLVWLSTEAEKETEQHSFCVWLNEQVCGSVRPGQMKRLLLLLLLRYGRGGIAIGPCLETEGHREERVCGQTLDSGCGPFG